MEVTITEQSKLHDWMWVTLPYLDDVHD